MIISFFEEFPYKENLQKASLIVWPSKLYLAAKSLQEFYTLKNTIKNKNIIEIIYWPLLEKEEGYWITPFTKKQALQKTFRELEQKKISVMLDLELPTRHNPALYLTQFLNFCYNKKIINKFIQNHHGKIYLAEYYHQENWYLTLAQTLGLHYPQQKNQVVKMLYHSLHSFTNEFLTKQLRLGKINYPHFIPAFGTITKGITKKEPILSPQQLLTDLKNAKKNQIEEVIIFRLGGLTKEYASVISVIQK